MDPTDLPPTYNEATTSPLPPPTPDPLATSPSRIHPLPSPLTTHLRTLPSRLRATQHALLTAQASTDLDLTYALVPHVEAFLADLTSMARTPPVAELTLVPEAAVPGGDGIKGWGMSGERERGREGEVVRVGRVVVEGQGEGGGEKKKGAGDTKGEKGGASASASSSSLRPAREAGFDEWGRFETDDRDGGEDEKGWWWFKDEDMARRLAGYLRPEPNLERKRVQAVVVEKKAEKSSRGWFGLGGGRKKSVGEQQQASPVSPALSSPGLPSPGAVEVDDSVKMTVRAEEVTFRRENEFGVWESRTGFGIVVTVRVRT